METGNSRSKAGKTTPRESTGMRRACATASSAVVSATAGVRTNQETSGVMCSAACPNCTVIPCRVSQSVIRDGVVSQPEICHPRAASNRANPAMPTPPMPIKWTWVGVRANIVRANAKSCSSRPKSGMRASPDFFHKIRQCFRTTTFAMGVPRGAHRGKFLRRTAPLGEIISQPVGG